MIFNVGDKVTIRKDLTAGKGYCMADNFHYCVAQRRQCEMAGETVTIESVHPGYYHVKESTACWTDAMFEKVVKETSAPTTGFKPGDIVRCIRSDSNPMVIGEEGVVICETVGDEDNSVLVEFRSFVDGHNGNGRGRRGHCWSCSPSQLRLIDRVKKSKFKVGDRVKYNGSHDLKIAGKVGTVIAHSIARGEPLVEFDGYVDGHNGRSRAERNGKDGHCWYCYDCELEIVADEPAEATFNQRIVITSNGKVSKATLYDGEKEICIATATMPDGVDFDFIGCAKRALKRLAMHNEPKSPEITPPLFNGALACIENKFDPRAFTIGKTYYAIDGVVLDNNGFRYEPIDWLNDDPNSGFCVYNTVDGSLVKFVVLTDMAKPE